MDYVSWTLALMGIAAASVIALIVVYFTGTGIASVIKVHRHRAKPTLE